MSEDNVKVAPVAQLVMLLKGNTPVGVELAWGDGVCRFVDACLTLNMTRAALNDAAWIMRQVERAAGDDGQSEGVDPTVQ